ncbi:MAG: Dabb family protein [Acidobacteria bacterium]|nr:Dabb family protein [Acidobacteriota bacterium]
MKKHSTRLPLLIAGAILLGVGWLGGQQTANREKTLMHVFAYTPLEGATQQDFENFKKATGDMIGKIPGLKKVWVGKLRRPLTQGDTKRLYGVAMEFDDEKALEVYATHPAHSEWEKVYEKVRVRGTTTLDILGE